MLQSLTNVPANIPTTAWSSDPTYFRNSMSHDNHLSCPTLQLAASAFSFSTLPSLSLPQGLCIY